MNSFVPSNSENLIIGLHRAILESIASDTCCHYEGLSQAVRACKHRFNNKQVKKILAVDTCFALLRHVTSVSCNLFIEDIRSSLASSHQKPVQICIARHLGEADHETTDENGVCTIPSIPTVSETSESKDPMKSNKSDIMCKFFQRGSCRYGVDCHFSHGKPVSADRIHERAEAPDAPSQPLCPEVPGLFEGAAVRVTGLAVATELNDKLAAVLSYLPGSARVRIKFRDGTIKAVKPSCLSFPATCPRCAHEVCTGFQCMGCVDEPDNVLPKHDKNSERILYDDGMEHDTGQPNGFPSDRSEPDYSDVAHCFPPSSPSSSESNRAACTECGKLTSNASGLCRICCIPWTD